MTDADLISCLINKDEKAFRLLVEKYQSIVFKACYHILNNVEDAEDIAQDVFVEAYLSISGFRGEAKISTWLYRIAINKSKNLLRKNRWISLTQHLGWFKLGEKGEVYDPIDHSAQAKMDMIEKTQDQNVLWGAIEGLPENQRIAFTLNKYDDLSYQEIAVVMQTSLSSVESLIHRAKINLQKKLVNYFIEK